MNHSIPSASERKESLVKQLLLLSEEKGRFLDSYFPIPGKDRSDMDQFLTAYTAEVQRLLASGEDVQSPSVVLIGSKISVEYIDYKETDTFTIVFPEEADPDDNRISFLSPVGRQLLLSGLNERLAIAAPAGSMQVTITSIN